jgi:hypothetical protein
MSFNLPYRKPHTYIVASKISFKISLISVIKCFFCYRDGHQNFVLISLCGSSRCVCEHTESLQAETSIAICSFLRTLQKENLVAVNDDLFVYRRSTTLQKKLSWQATHWIVVAASRR